MGYNWAAKVAQCTKKLKAYGSTCTLSTLTKKFDPTQGKTQNTANTTTVYVLNMDLTEATKEFGGIELAEGQQGAWVSVGAFVPQVKDTLTFPGASIWKIDKVQPLSPGPVTLMYKILMTQ